MQNVSKEIYRKIDGLFSGLPQIEPFTRVDLSAKGLPEINMVVFESTPDKINFVLSRYENDEHGRPIANPSFEIAANPTMKTANVVTYKDHHYFHEATTAPEEIGTMAQSKANLLLYTLLGDLKQTAKNQEVHAR